MTHDRRGKLRAYAAVGARKYRIVEGQNDFQGLEASELVGSGEYRRIELAADGLVRLREVGGLPSDAALLAADPPPNPIEALRQTVPGLR